MHAYQCNVHTIHIFTWLNTVATIIHIVKLDAANIQGWRAEFITLKHLACATIQ